MPLRPPLLDQQINRASHYYDMALYTRLGKLEGATTYIDRISQVERCDVSS
jgi:hypothetical protein